jgi:hypothetical protein
MHFKFLPELLTIASLFLGSSPAAAQSTPDYIYDSQDAWLCRPGRSDLCSTDQVLTRLAADGSKTTQTYRPQADAPIDCFYVYPTISLDPNPHSTLMAGPGENRAVSQQFAPFASVCRPFAPMYRQITLAGLRYVMAGNSNGVNAELPIEDVRAAWRHYLSNDNRGRGVVLIGHSQGSRILIELLKRDIDSKPAQKHLVSAMLIGFNVLVPTGQKSGGSLNTLIPCSSATDTGCIVAYSTFRETAPPPNNARFGRSNNASTEVVCTDPTKLSGQPLKSMLVRERILLGQSALNGEWAQAFEAVESPFVDMPGFLQTTCVKDGLFHYLSMSINSKSQGKRPANIPGDIVVNERTYDDWGLHLVDVNLAMGNLIELTRLQGLSWKSKNP